LQAGFIEFAKKKNRRDLSVATRDSHIGSRVDAFRCTCLVFMLACSHVDLETSG
jgi:hypothetical protein